VAPQRQHRVRPGEERTVRLPQDEAVGQAGALARRDETPEGLSLQGGEANGPYSIRVQRESYREVAEAAAPVVEEMDPVAVSP
jgi:hypothetical protein